MSPSLLRTFLVSMTCWPRRAKHVSAILSPPGETCFGHLVPARNADAFAETIANLTDNCEDAAHMAQCARAYVTKQHSPEAMRAAYARLLEELWRAR